MANCRAARVFKGHHQTSTTRGALSMWEEFGGEHRGAGVRVTQADKGKGKGGDGPSNVGTYTAVCPDYCTACPGAADEECCPALTGLRAAEETLGELAAATEAQMREVCPYAWHSLRAVNTIFRIPTVHGKYPRVLVEPLGGLGVDGKSSRLTASFALGGYNAPDHEDRNCARMFSSVVNMKGKGFMTHALCAIRVQMAEGDIYHFNSEAYHAWRMTEELCSIHYDAVCYPSCSAPARTPCTPHHPFTGNVAHRALCYSGTIDSG